MATTIKWIDNNSIETAHRIYKSSTYFTKDNLPAPLVELGPDITEYVDSAGVDGENWYIVSALLNDYEVFSEPFITGLATAYLHDIFGDGSAVATYNFGGDATDLGGNTNIDLTGFSYVNGLIDQAVDCGSSSEVRAFVGLDNMLGNVGGFTVSAWINPSITQNARILAQGITSSNQTAIGLINNKLYSLDSNLVVYEGTIALPNNSFSHATWTYNDTTDEIGFFVNGVLDSTATSTVGFSVNTPLYFATYSQGSGQFDGFIDQFRIFNRALTQQEVDTLYQEGAAYL